jgi:CheY-like chemotaxis protein
MMLLHEGDGARMALDAEEALRVLTAWVPSLILTDRPSRIVALTAYAPPGDHARAASGGYDGDLSKPLAVDSLWHWLAEWSAPAEPNGRA